MSSNSGGGGGEVSSSSRSNNASSQSNQRYSSLIYDSEVFLTKLAEFKPQSLGCLEARRKSSSTLIFPNPQQACMGPPKCPRYPHNVKPTPGYWIECHGPGVPSKSVLSSAAAAPDHSTTATKATQQAEDQVAHQASEPRSTPVKPDNLKLTSVGSSVPQYLPTTPTAERIITRSHDKDNVVASSSVDNEEMMTKSHSNDRLLEHEDDSFGSGKGKNQAHRIELARSDCDRHSSPEIANVTNKTAGDQEKVSEGRNGGTTAATNKSANELRKRLNKRTITRDDIDLHRPRRGTPNITITEPSFNQSTITYQAGGGLNNNNRNRFSRQESELKRMDSADSASVRVKIQTCQQTEAQTTSIDDDLIDIESGSSHFLLKQDSSDNEDAHYQQDNSTSLDFKSFRCQSQQHRPSIIREDSGMEKAESGNVNIDKSSQQQQDKSSNLYCGLSTTVFKKKSYQESYQQLQDNEKFKDGSLELISFEEENYEKHYYGHEHWNYFTNDELLGPVMLSLKQEVNNQRDHFHVLLRTVSYTLHGTIPASTICADRYDREAIVRELSEIAKLKPPLMLGQLPSTPDELLKLDHIFIKTELKVGVIYIKAGQAESEEAILGNKEESALFSEFLDLLGDRITLKGFDKYKGGLDTVHNLTGTESVYTMWRNIEIMFHVSTMLPHEENDPQKLQKKRHIGNDIVCVAFIESDDTLFWPGCIKSYFLHTFITVRTSPKALKEGEKRKYSVSCVCRNEVQYAFKPYLVEEDEFLKSDYFREWLLVKIVNGERASYSAPKFARMQDRTRSQLLEDIITNLANHLVTGQIPKPYRRGSWRPLGHTRASSPLEDSMKDYFEDYDQLAKDFHNAFCGPSRSMLCDVVFRVKDQDGTYKLVHGVRAILAIRSRIFLEMLYGFVPPGTGRSSFQNQTSLRAIEMKALSGESSSGANLGFEQQTKSLLAKRGSVGADSSRKIGEKERRQSMLPALSKSISQKPNYLTVPNTGSGATGGGSGGAGGAGSGGAGGSAGGMIKNVFNRFVSGNWSGWSGNMKGYKGESMHIKVDQNKTKVDLNSLAICKEIAKIDADKLSQREFEIKEFDYDTFQQTIEYIHNGQCKLSYETIPGLICAAEHYELPDLLHACFHHANTHMKLSAAPKMMNSLYQSSCFYVTAMQLLDSIYEYIDPHGNEFLSKQDFYELQESVLTSLLARKSLQVSELRKFQAMDNWAKHQISIRQEQLRKRNSAAEQLLHRQKSSEQQEEPATDSTATTATTAALAAAATCCALQGEEWESEYRALMLRLNKDVSIKLDKISNEDLVRIVLPTKVFSNDKIFDVMADESRLDY